LNVANEGMCRPIRALTEGRGYDARNHRLAVFGGAGGQHACDVARNLGINTVVIHKYSSILSAYGMALAEVVHESTEPTSETYTTQSLTALKGRLAALEERNSAELAKQGLSKDRFRHERYLNMRYRGTDTSLMVLEPPSGDFEDAFLTQHQTEFSFTVPGRPILIDDVRVRSMASDGTAQEQPSLVDQVAAADSKAKPPPEPAAYARVYFSGLGHVNTPVFKLQDITTHSHIAGPAIIIDTTQTIVVTPGATAITLDQHVVIRIGEGTQKTSKEDIADTIDPVQLSVFGHRFMSIAEQMGRTLQKTSVSLNIKERLDFSCAIFGPSGDLVANG
jgi:5-oxoprolinase (ATP-hydrolysing)